MGIFAQMMDGLAASRLAHQTIMIDAIYLKAYRTASSLRGKRGPRPPDRADQRRHEHEAARGDGQKWPPDQVLHNGWPDQRLHRGRYPAERSARCKVAPG